MEFWDIYESEVAKAPDRLETGAAHGRNDDKHDHAGDWSEVKEESSTWRFVRCQGGMTTTQTHIDVVIQETRGDGVFDAVGGELWEASLLLCADMVINPTNAYEGSSVLEFGAGVGLPSLFLAKKNAVLANKGGPSSFCITDFDYRCLSNLASVVPLIDDGAICLKEDDVDSSVTVSVERFDWFHPETFQLNDRFDVAFGCALVYNNDHACLADICRDLLSNGRCKRIIIIQIKDRPGLTRFLARVDGLGLCCTVEPVSLDVYKHAQRISSETLAFNETECCHQKLFRVPLEPRNPLETEEKVSVDPRGLRDPLVDPTYRTSSFSRLCSLIVSDAASFVRIVIKL